MNFWRVIPSLMLVVAVMPQLPLCAVDIPVDAVQRPAVSGSVESLLLWRGGLPDRPLYFDVASPSVVPLDAAMVNPSMAAGPRFRIDLSPSGDGAWEFNYFTVQNFGGSRSAVSPAGDLEQDNIFGFLFPDVTSAQAVSSAGIQSFELNRRERFSLGRME